VFFRKTCSKSDNNCKWKGDIIKRKRLGHCFWKKKTSNKYQRICCKWSKVCKGSCHKGTRRCYTTLKKCKWTGRVITTKKNTQCEFIHSDHGKRKRCCDYRTKCINYDRLSCKSKRKPKCWATRKCKYVGPFIKRTCSRKCQKVPTGKYGSRKRCCHTCKTCQTFKFTETPKKRPDVCKTKLNKCFWKGNVVVKRHHKKCEIKAFGYNRERKRCCHWIVRCVKKHCKQISKKCKWIGCVFSTIKQHNCRMKMKNDHEKQKLCCSYNRRCCSGKCVNYNQKCKFVGKIITSKHHWVCKDEKVGKNATRKRCCRHVRRCYGKKCTTKLGKCEYKGCKKSVQKINKCSLKVLTKNVKCKYCCSSERKCDCGVCRITNTNCRCTKRYSIVHFTKCKKSLKNKGVKQSLCCVYRRSCVDRKCKVVKTKKCKWTGFEDHTEKKICL